MRLDKFLKVTQLIKRRSAANEAAGEGFIKVNGKGAKPSQTIKPGDILEMDMWNYYKKIRVISLPERNSVPKESLDAYVFVEKYEPKNNF